MATSPRQWVRTTNDDFGLPNIDILSPLPLDSQSSPLGNNATLLRTFAHAQFSVATTTLHPLPYQWWTQVHVYLTIGFVDNATPSYDFPHTVGAHGIIVEQLIPAKYVASTPTTLENVVWSTSAGLESHAERKGGGSAGAGGPRVNMALSFIDENLYLSDLPTYGKGISWGSYLGTLWKGNA